MGNLAVVDVEMVPTSTIALGSFAAFEINQPLSLIYPESRLAEFVAPNEDGTPYTEQQLFMLLQGMNLQGRDGEPGEKGDSGSALPPIPFAFGDAARAIYTPASNVLITGITIYINTAFNGSTPSSILIGTAGSPDLFETSIYADPNELGDYEIPLNSPIVAGTAIYLSITLGVGCTQGDGTVLINAVATA